MSKQQQTRLWASLHRRQKIVREFLLPCTQTDALSNGLVASCKAFDISVPIVLAKHHRELGQFSRTDFTQKDFMDAFPYTRLSIEIFGEDEAGPARD